MNIIKSAADIKFTALTDDHLKLLHKWMNIEYVHKWWGENHIWSIQDIENKYNSYVDGYKLVDGTKKAIHPYIIMKSDQPIGYIQYYNIDDFTNLIELPKSTAGLDLYIGKIEYINCGLGPAIIKKFIDNYISQNFDNYAVELEKENIASIKCFTKLEFKNIPNLQCKNKIFMLKSKATRNNLS
jgi:aminoglycoside 6'-N-acetyltransferase